MGKILIECEQKKIDLKDIASAVYKVLGQKENFKVELVFLDSVQMQELNKNTRSVDSVTDVLSYPTLDGIRGVVLTKKDCVTELEGRYILLGSIVLCEEKIKAQALEYGHSEERERNYLIIHGLLHLFGYDHMIEEDKKQMRDKEKEVLALLGIQE